MLRVLHVNSGNLYGGVERMLVTLARYRSLCESMQPWFAVCFRGQFASELDNAGVPTFDLGATRGSRPWTIWRARRRLRALLHRSPPDIVVCHAPWVHAMLAPVVRAARIPLALWVHNPFSPRGWPERWAKRTPPDVVVANSHFTAQSIATVYPRMRTQVVYCPVPASTPTAKAREKIRTELQTPMDAVVIVQASRMEPLKGQMLLLDALGRLLDLPNWVCWQLGGPQRPHEVAYLNALTRRAKALGIVSRLRFVGHRTDVPTVLAAADIHCQPNTGPEAFGIAFVEAMLAHLPVVTTDLGGAREVVDSDCALLVAPGDVEALTASLRRLIQDPVLRARLAAHAPARARAIADPATQLRHLHSVLLDAAVPRRARAVATVR